MNETSQDSSLDASTSNQMHDVQSIVMKMNLSDVKELLSLMSNRDINILRQPETGLVMMCAKDSFDIEFCLGEVLVTEAEVEYAGNKGYAMVLGEEDERSLAVASIDAIFQSNDKQLRHAIQQILITKRAVIADREEIERNLVASTRVNFENMVKG